MSAEPKQLHCGAKARFFDNRRCTLAARHPGWHESHKKDEFVRWDNAGSYEIQVPSKKAAA